MPSADGAVATASGVTERGADDEGRLRLAQARMDCCRMWFARRIPMGCGT